MRERTLVIAHRGASGVAPENTMAAFVQAFTLGADMIELDVHLSRDGEVVVIHDDTLERCTNGRGYVVDHTLAELKKLDAGSWFGAGFAGERVPSLDEVLLWAKDKIRVNIEIKIGHLGPYSMDELADRTLARVEERGMVEQVLFSSFYPPALERIKAANSRAQVALLLNRPWRDVEEVILTPYATLNCARDTLTREAVLAAQRRGFKLNVWTVNEEREMAWFLELAVDGIITNYPERLIKLLPVGSLKTHELTN